MLINATENLAENIGIAPACEGMGVARSTLYYKRTGRQHPKGEAKPRPSPPRALDQKEKQQVLDMLHCERFVDKSPAEIWATLLDEEIYLLNEMGSGLLLAVSPLNDNWNSEDTQFQP